MYPYEIDIAVLLIFFNRPDTFRQVFEQVKKARPSRLYLSCDGARAGNMNDVEKINQCKKIAEDIDWQCEVYHNYMDTNLGCGRGPKAAIDFMFEREEYGIILEDDCVPSVSFFRFCKELLEKYQNDSRVFCITGINAEKHSTDCPHSYFFGCSGTNWGWATWKRNWNQFDFDMKFIEDPYVYSLLQDASAQWNGQKIADKEMKRLKQHSRLIRQGEVVSYWDEQWQMVRRLNHQLAIIPTKNMITNIGVGETSTHAKTIYADKKAGETIGKPSVLFNRRFEIEFPLLHPEYIIQNLKYDRMFKREFYDNFFIKVRNKIKQVVYKLFRK